METTPATSSGIHSSTAGSSSIAEIAATIATSVSALHADNVDQQARFPSESVAALRDSGLLGALVPIELGGMGASVSEVTAACTELAQHCASTAMIFAMHHIQVACLVRHSNNNEYFNQLLSRIAQEGRLVASATSEAGTGGDIGQSICAVHRDGQRFTLSKEASVISYGSESDDILLTARRHPDSPPTDQVLVHVPTDSANLVETGQWDTLGMRGTRSLGFLLDTEGDVSQIMEATGSEVLAHTMVPVTHLTWAGVWLGIAENATTKARSYVRAQARKDPEVTPPSATELAQLYMQLETCRAAVDSASERFAQHEADGAGATDALQTVQMNNLKLMLSTHVVSIVQSALAVCGISGYRNDSPYSLGRQIRDSLSAPIMIHNDRIVAHNASLLSLLKGK